MRPIEIAMLAMLLALGGCASQPSAPEWVDGEPHEYPASRYLIGRGQGASAEEARDRARADLAKIFESQVMADSQDEQSFRSSGGYEQRSVRRIAVRTERIVEGVEIARSWHEAAGGSYHALAVLPRLKAAHAMREEIARLDEAARLHAGRAAKAQELFSRIAATRQALAALAERAAHQQALRVVDPSGIGEPPSMSIARVRADLETLLKRVKIAPRVVRDSSGELAPILAAGVAAAGFLAEDAGSAEYLLEASFVLDAAGPLDGWHWQSGRLEVRLVEAAGGRSRGSRRWHIKAAALSPAVAAQRALDQADAVLKSELRSALLGIAAAEAP